ncbi:MAG: HyaD/HybD family hydrogenase maturation endopeptidase [Gammaproteobacteria bacterium]
MKAADETEVLVLGIGNLLWADEGFGVRAVEALHRSYELPAGVIVMDGGTQGLYLLPYVQGARRLLVFDAVDYGLAPGSLLEVHDGEVPRFTGAKKMSLHQTGFQEVLSAAELTGALPRRMTLIGVQAERLDDWGGALSRAVAERLDEAVHLGARRLAGWGYPPRPRAGGYGAGAPALGHGLDRASFERGEADDGDRPLSAQSAAGGRP